MQRIHVLMRLPQQAHGAVYPHAFALVPDPLRIRPQIPRSSAAAGTHRVLELERDSHDRENVLVLRPGTGPIPRADPAVVHEQVVSVAVVFGCAAQVREPQAVASAETLLAGAVGRLSAVRSALVVTLEFAVQDDLAASEFALTTVTAQHTLRSPRQLPSTLQPTRLTSYSANR